MCAYIYIYIFYRLRLMPPTPFWPPDGPGGLEMVTRGPNTTSMKMICWRSQNGATLMYCVYVSCIISFAYCSDHHG